MRAATRLEPALRGPERRSVRLAVTIVAALVSALPAQAAADARAAEAALAGGGRRAAGPAPLASGPLARPALALELRPPFCGATPFSRATLAAGAAAAGGDRDGAAPGAASAPDGAGPGRAAPGDGADDRPPDGDAQGRLRAREPPPDAGALDFDLLGKPAQPPPHVDEGRIRLRRSMLTAHQAFGFGLFALQLATTAVGQLAYLDHFGGGVTARYDRTHAVLAYSTLGAFVATGALALLAPSSPLERSEGFDRVTLHKVAQFTAAAGMLAQGILGVVTARREGYLDQRDIATAHLAIGYATLAAVAVGVGAIVF